jgi:hypothetical protein
MWLHIEGLRRELVFTEDTALEVAEELHRIADPLWWPGSWFNADRRSRAQQLAEHRSRYEERKAKNDERWRRLEQRELGAKSGAEEE